MILHLVILEKKINNVYNYTNKDVNEINKFIELILLLIALTLNFKFIYFKVY